MACHNVLHDHHGGTVPQVWHDWPEGSARQHLTKNQNTSFRKGSPTACPFLSVLGMSPSACPFQSVLGISRGFQWGRMCSDGAQLDKASHRVFMQRVLAGQVEHMHGVAVGQGAPRGQHSQRGGGLLWGQEVGSFLLLPRWQHVRQRGVARQVWRGGWRGGLSKGQGGTGSAQGDLPRQGRLIAG